MAKRPDTVKLERAIHKEMTSRIGIYGCHEVTIDDERVDYLTYDSKRIIRCFEIKVTLKDFNSKAKKTFIGHYNYYVLTPELYEKVKELIPVHIGVYVNHRLMKKARRQDPLVEEDVLIMCLLRALYREFAYAYAAGDENIIRSMRSRLNFLEKRNMELTDRLRKVTRKFGHDWEETKWIKVEEEPL